MRAGIAWIVLCAACSSAMAEVSNAVRLADVATMKLTAVGSSIQRSINGFDVPIQRGSAPVNIGKTLNQQDNIFARWQATTDGTTHLVSALWYTQNGADILPSGTMITQGQTTQVAEKVKVGFGIHDPVSFRGWVTEADLVRATLFISSSRGQAIDQVFNIKPTLKDPWLGQDYGEELINAGTGINYILAEYEFVAIPAPGTAVLVGAGALALSRRRRTA